MDEKDFAWLEQCRLLEIQGESVANQKTSTHRDEWIPHVLYICVWRNIVYLTKSSPIFFVFSLPLMLCTSVCKTMSDCLFRDEYSLSIYLSLSEDIEDVYHDNQLFDEKEMSS